MNNPNPENPESGGAPDGRPKDHKRDIARALERIAPQRRQKVSEFVDWLRENNLTDSAIYGHVNDATSLEFLDKPYEQINREDVRRWRARQQEELELRSLHNRILRVRKFLTWVHNGDDEEKPRPDCVRGLKPPPLPKKSDVVILAREELLQILKATKSQRERALLHALYDAGLRIGELRLLRIEHVTFDQYGALIWVPGGKTGPRRVRVVESVPDLQLWLSMHPGSGSPEAPLFTASEYKATPIGEQTVRNIVKRVCKKAGINRRVYPHLFRHTRATHLAGPVTEPNMRAHFGWTDGSRMPATYVHLAGRDVDKSVLNAHGITPRETPESRSPGPQRWACPRCKRDNSPALTFCGHCGNPKDVAVAMKAAEADRASRLAVEFFIQIFQDPVVRKTAAEQAKERGLLNSLKVAMDALGAAAGPLTGSGTGAGGGRPPASGEWGE